MHGPIRTIRRFLASSDRFGATPFHSLSANFDKAAALVRFFYLVTAFRAATQMPELHRIAARGPDLEPVWPLFWIDGLPLLVLADVFTLACFGLAMLAYWKPDNVLFRAGVALALLFCAAFPASLGAVNHAHHAWLWISVCLIFLPASKSRAGKLGYCLGFATAQACCCRSTRWPVSGRRCSAR